jgi:hypothetical protein
LQVVYVTDALWEGEEGARLAAEVRAAIKARVRVLLVRP